MEKLLLTPRSIRDEHIDSLIAKKRESQVRKSRSRGPKAFLSWKQMGGKEEERKDGR